MQPPLRKVKEKDEKEQENEIGPPRAEGKIGREEKERPSARGRERKSGEMAPVIGERRRLRSVWKVDVKYS